ncbi:MAG: isochorismatase family protein [Planctomycetota bacterium]
MRSPKVRLPVEWTVQQRYLDPMTENSRSDEPSESAPPLPRSPELMRADDTLLMLIDVQPRLLAAQPDAKRIVWNCRRLLEAARDLGVHTLATEQSPHKLGPTVAELADQLPTPPHAKDSFSAAAFADVAAQDESAGLNRMLLCGIETHVCVQQSACDLLAAGYQVAIAVDAVGSRFPIDHDTALRRLEGAGALLTTVEAAMFEWCEIAGTPQFKRVSELAKRQPDETGGLT